MTEEHFGSRSKKGRGRAQASLDLIDAMFEVAEAAQPITGRGVGYKLFTARPDPVDGRAGNAAGLPAAQGGPRGRDHSVGMDCR